MENKKIIIIGCSISGGLFARRLLQLHPNANIKIYEKMGADQINQHWTQPVNGAALNINPNGMTTIKKNDPLLYDQLINMANPRVQVKAVSMDSRLSKPLFCINMLDYAKDPGIIIRWNDIINLIRQPLHHHINYNCQILHYSRRNGKFILIIKNQDECFTEECDILIAADGRFSKIREIYQKPNVVQHNVVNFRLLVPNLRNYNFGDLTLHYNYNNQNNTLARIGVACVAPTKFLKEESIYIFGNFKMDTNFDKNEWTRQDFINLYHNNYLTEQGQILIDIILSNFDTIHWARFQSTDTCFQSKEHNFYFLGDAAHSFPPSLGQGATLAIEDAYFLANHVFENFVNFERHLDRVEHIKNCSEFSAQHLIHHDLEMEINTWNDIKWLDKMQKIWSI